MDIHLLEDNPYMRGMVGIYCEHMIFLDVFTAKQSVLKKKGNVEIIHKMIQTISSPVSTVYSTPSQISGTYMCGPHLFVRKRCIRRTYEITSPC